MTVTAITQSEYSRKMAHVLDDRLERWRLRAESEGVSSTRIQELTDKYALIIDNIKAIHDLKTSSEMKIKTRGIISDLSSDLSKLKKKAPNGAVEKRILESYQIKRNKLKTEMVFVQQLVEQVSEISKYHHTTAHVCIDCQQSRRIATEIFDLITKWKEEDRIQLNPQEKKKIKRIEHFLKRK